MDYKARAEQLEYVVRETLWMAHRYADGRRTFAPSTFNECKDIVKELGIELQEDTTTRDPVYATDGDLGKWDSDKQRFQKE